MSRHLTLLLGVALLFGVATGIYEFVLPFFLRAQGIHLETMGLIYALAGVAMLVARIYMGGLSDRWGRKGLYGWSLAAAGVVTALIPAFPHVAGQICLKVVRDIATLTRETLHPIILYEEGREAFLRRISLFRGVEYLLQGGGTLLAGVLIARLGGGADGYRAALLVAGAALGAGALWWAGAFRERVRPEAGQIIRVRALLSFDLHPNLLLILISGVIFSFGIMLSHSFYLPLFFKDRFGLAPGSIAVIMVLHRFTLALPLFVVGHLPLRDLRAWYIIGLLLQGVTTAVSALLPHAGWSAGVFLLHDLIGAGLWSPIQATLIQRFSRDATRGMEVGKVLAWSSLGSILGPLAAGWLAARGAIYPFFFSGVLMALAAIPILWLNLWAPAAAGSRTGRPAPAA